MQATLTFNLPDEESDFKLATQALSMWTVLWEFDQWLRGEIKYRDHCELQPVRDKFHEILTDREIELI